MASLTLSLRFLTFSLLAGFTSEDNPVAILRLKGRKLADTCVEYNPLYSKLRTSQDTPMYSVYIVPPDEACKDQSIGYTSAVFFITPRGNCSFFEKLELAEKSHAKQVILISDNNKNSEDFPIGTTEQHKQIYLSVVKIGAATWSSMLKTIGQPTYAKVFVAYKPPFDPNIAVLWIIAVFTVVTGSYWSGRVRRQTPTSEKWNDDGESDFGDEARFPAFSPIFILVFIIMVALVLLLLYYFYNYLIYVVIAVFAIASAERLYICLSALTSLYNCSECRLPENNIPLLNSRPRIVDIVLFMISIAVGILWAVMRNDDYAWILQDILGVCMCASFLKFFYLPDLKVGTIVLVAMLLYDVFFVFITPLFSKTGMSVMVSVAKGDGRTEAMPMVIKIPKMIVTDMWLCEQPFSLLGLGDILLPGVFVSFCHNFDVIAQTKYPVYFITSACAYAFGLFMAFLVLAITQIPQPALLYLSPCLLIAVTITGSYRRELKELWNGEVYVNRSISGTDLARQLLQSDESKDDQFDKKDTGE